ncbi:LOW QUALITY PROTEIN: hypothetical protein U9M48_013390 [Paspalum notatum var. saurae]|uniref:Reverse transcriptase Ty1/copia-type domain-containing protein n=1 Tax=Paspalum notatum var. saurae TaxID=547442 RepID=A0AAQ3T0B1_PASNO
MAQLSPVPSSFKAAHTDSNWLPSCGTPLGTLCRDLLALTGSSTKTSRPKVLWSATKLAGSYRRPGIDYTDTFSPVVKPATTHTVLSLALSRNWPIHLLYVKNAFLHGSLSETTYYPFGFEDLVHPNFICRLRKSLYGFMQALRAWYSRFATHMLSMGFLESKSETSLFIYRQGSDIAYLLVNVDDIVLTASSASLLQWTYMHYSRISLCQTLVRFITYSGCMYSTLTAACFIPSGRMSDCKPCVTLVDTNHKLSATEGACVDNATDFRSLAGALQYLTFTRPDIAYAVQQVCLHMHDPRQPHLATLKLILRCICGTLDLGLLLRPSTSSELIVYSDADSARCPDTHKSTSSYAVFLGDNLISRSSKRQMMVSISSAEAEYRAVANALRQLLLEHHAHLRRSTLVYCNNISTVYMAFNPVQHQRMKHIEIDLHFVRERDDFLNSGVL